VKNEKNSPPFSSSTPPLSKPLKQTQKTLTPSSPLPLHTWKQTHLALYKGKVKKKIEVKLDKGKFFPYRFEYAS